MGCATCLLWGNWPISLGRRGDGSDDLFVRHLPAYLRADGQMSASTDADLVVRHMDYLIEHLGEGGVALGSDYDGAIVPQELATAAQLPLLIDRLRRAGYDDALLTKICFENWMSILARTID